MDCASCGRANRTAARFCSGCGKPLARQCTACGTANHADAQFCDTCGASLTAPAAASGVDAGARKVVTIVFADLIGSTSLHERLDAESARQVMDRYYRALHAAVDAHGGTVVKLLGDGVMAAFGVPRVAEDDAIRAVRAAVGMQHAFRSLVDEHAGVVHDVGLRVAVNTGEVVVSDDHADVVGDPVNVAARLQQEAQDGDVLIGESTRRLVAEQVTLAPFGALSLKGRTEKVAAYRVVSLERPASGPTIPFVGRDDELRRLMAVCDAALAAPSARLAVILGSPGQGKSRLLAEFARRLGRRAAVLTARCDPAGGATFAPLADALRAFLRIGDSGAEAARAAIDAALPAAEPERARVAAGVAALLAGTPPAPEETFFVVRRFLAALAAAQAIVLAIDDLQWAEPLLIDLTEHLVQWSSGVPLLILVAARPELRDTRPSLTRRAALISDLVILSGLEAGAAARLAASVVGADELPASVAGRVLATSEGNPLFVGELVRMLVQNGALKREGERWTAGVALADLEMPPTIHALLAARIERLRPEERTVLERAAVVGRHFSRGAVAHLLGRDTPDIDARLESLRRSELIEPAAGGLLGEPLLRFHHALIRDAAYRRLLKGTRAELHGRFADWLEAHGGDAVEHEETIGWHLEQAHQHLRELGPLDEHGRTFGERAARYLASAGRRALARDDLPLAANLLGRAIDRLEAADPARSELALDRCEALLAAGDVAPAAAALDELARFGAASDRLRAWHTCFAGQLAVLTAPQGLRQQAKAVEDAAAALATAGDAAGEAKAHSVHALALARLGEIGACEAALDRALAAARRAGDRRRANAVLAAAPVAALWGPSPVTRSSGRCLDVVRVLRITQGAPAVEAVALRCQAVLEALRGRTDAARRMIATSRRMVEELGITPRLLEADVCAGFIELLDGDAATAERWLQAAYTGLRAHGLGIDAAQAAALLGRALIAQGRAAEAEALSHDSEALAGDDLKAAIAWRGVRAEALARRGEHAAAIELAHAGVDIAAATDALLDHADARVALAAALRAAGRNDAAADEEAQANALWEAKGATLLTERGRRTGGGDQPVAPPRDADRAVAGAARHHVRANAATANAARMDAAAAARDLAAFLAVFADGAQTVHHPTRTTCATHQERRAFEALLGAQELTFEHQAIATLGKSLALCRRNVSGAGVNEAAIGQSGGANADSLVLIEVDAHGQRLCSEFFAAERLGDAIARLYERYADRLPPGPARVRAAARARSVAALLGPFELARYATGIAPDVEFVDLRTVGFPSGRGIDELLRSIGTLLETADDVATRVDDVLALRADRLLMRWTTSGTDRVSRGPFEWRFLRLCIFGDDGLLTRAEQFDSERDDMALARFEAAHAGHMPARRDTLDAKSAGEQFANAFASQPAQAMGGASPAARMADRVGDRRTDAVSAEPAGKAADRTAEQGDGTARAASLASLARPNSATAAADRVRAAFDRRDWAAVRAACAPHAKFEDRRRHALISGDADWGVADLQGLAGTMPDIHYRRELVTTAGDRIALERVLWSGGSASGRVEVEYLGLTEVDESGRIVASVGFDLDDWRAANRDAFARWFASDPAAAAVVGPGFEFLEALNLRDPVRLRAVLADDVVFCDHRLAGMGFIEGVEAYVEAVRALWELAPDVQFESACVLALEPYGFVTVAQQFGTLRQGGVFERPTVGPMVVVGGRISRMELFEPENVDAALARFAELRPDPLRIPDNAATRASRRWQEYAERGDWEAMRRLCAPVVYESRRRFDRTSGDCETAITNTQVIAGAQTRAVRTVLATAGDRLALEHVRWTGPDHHQTFEIETLQVIEVDAEGRVVAAVVFDPSDRRAAIAEVSSRYARSEAARWIPAAAFELVQAMNDHDLARCRAALSDDFVFDDHRLTGSGRIEGADAYLASVAALFAASPDVMIETMYDVACDARGILSVIRMLGTLAEGGEFESVLARLALFRHGRHVATELFELEDLPRARARFEQVRADPDAVRSAGQAQS